MSSIFGRSWYVDRGRIQMFLPLNGSIAFEIDRTGVGGILGNPTFSTNYGNSLLERNGEAVNSLIFGGSDYFIFNDRLNEFLNNAVYGSGRRTSICFWVWTADDTNPDGDGTLANTRGVSNNVVLSDNYFKGYSFGRETMTSVMNMTDDVTKAAVSADINKHVVTARYKVPSSPESVSSELIDGSDGFLNVPSGRWVFVTYTLDHSSADDYVTTMHLRFKDNEGNHKHYYCTGSDMDSYTINGEVETVVGRTGGAWTLGCSRVPVGNSYDFSKFLMGAMRNLMLYSIVLDNDQQQSIYDNGIDPYVADTSPNTEPDADQYDKRFWGKYGIIATGSLVKVEKSQIRLTTQAAALDGVISAGVERPQNTRRFSVGARDGAIISIARNDAAESNTANPEVIDSTNDANDWGSTYDAYGNDITSVDNSATTQPFSAAAWRGGFVTGESKISKQNSKAIWGGLIDGVTDMRKLQIKRLNGIGEYEDINDPETLPSGKYLARLIDNGTAPGSGSGDEASDGYLFYYPSYLPKYYYRDRLGRSWRRHASVVTGSTGNDGESTLGTSVIYDNTYVNEIFWEDDIKRYDKIEWVKAYVDETNGVIMNADADEVQLDDAMKWSKINWEFAIYEVDREPTLSNEFFTNRIKLTLISSDFKYSAIYYKFRTSKLSGLIPIGSNYGTLNPAFSGWHFDSFNFEQSSLAGVQAGDHLNNEILRRIYLPHAAIPRLTIPMFETSVSGTYQTAASTSCLSSNYMGCRGVVYDSHLGYVKDMGGMNGSGGIIDTVVAPISGYYMAVIKVLVVGKDNWKYPTITFHASSQMIVERYRTGGGEEVSYTTTCDVVLTSYYNINEMMTVHSDFPIMGVSIIHISNPAISANGVLTGINAVDESSSSDWLNYVKTSGGRKYIEINGIGVKYTKYNYKGMNPGGTTKSDIHVPIADTIVDQTISPYSGS